MTTKVEKADRMIEAFQRTHALVLSEAEGLDQKLTQLRFEGKSTMGRNLKGIHEAVEFLKSRLGPHMEMEERFLFPFLKTHVPKLESVIHLLYTDHQDFKQSLANFESVVQELSSAENTAGRGQLFESLREIGIYLIYLLRHHIHTEEISIYDVACHELRSEEKAELEKLVSQ